MSETAKRILLTEDIFTAGKHCLMANDITKLQNSILFLREITCLLLMKIIFHFPSFHFFQILFFNLRMLSTFSSRFKPNTEKVEDNKLSLKGRFVIRSSGQKTMNEF